MTTKDDAPEFLLFVASKKLSDGSKAYNVHFGDLVFNAVTQVDAIELAEKISDAINDHTVNTSDYIEE